ncbi:hypothetical protein AVEN_96869-1 [Araneus ventricosus]|uniref:Uncharacterized protein n=1 Tax=Araneus ventricosus TaxID=182803 RepID=A0A4Y2Q6H8_ARAVE|nr:hypothetical protein AVEN_96869-1 [Araneus ventricosus]
MTVKSQLASSHTSETQRLKGLQLASHQRFHRLEGRKATSHEHLRLEGRSWLTSEAPIHDCKVAVTSSHQRLHMTEGRSSASSH